MTLAAATTIDTTNAGGLAGGANIGLGAVAGSSLTVNSGTAGTLQLNGNVTTTGAAAL